MIHRFRWRVCCALILILQFVLSPIVPIASAEMQAGDTEPKFASSKDLDLAEPSSESLNSEGVALVKSGNMAEAVSRFSEALELDPSHIGARFNLAFAYQRMERLEEAESEYRKVLEIRDLTRAHLMLGLLYEKKGEDSNAINEFETVLKKEPDNKVALTKFDDLLFKVTIEEAIGEVLEEAGLGKAGLAKAGQEEAVLARAALARAALAKAIEEADRKEAERKEAERKEAERKEAERVEAER